MNDITLHLDSNDETLVDYFTKIMELQRKHNILGLFNRTWAVERFDIQINRPEFFSLGSRDIIPSPETNKDIDITMIQVEGMVPLGLRL